jgi:type 1 glutamine amidotransferase
LIGVERAASFMMAGVPNPKNAFSRKGFTMHRFVVPSLALILCAALAAPAGAQGKQKKEAPGGVGATTQGKTNYFDKIVTALPEKGPAEPKAKRRVLIFNRPAGFPHSSIPVGTKAFVMMGDKTGAYIAEATNDPAYFASDKLSKFDAVVMLNTTGDCLRPESGNVKELEETYKKSLHEFVQGGKGLMGTHSATDTYHNWPAYNKMMGGTFAGHPWNAGDTVGIKIVAPDHPLNAPFKGQNFKIKDEIYQYRADTADPKERTYLLTLDPDNTNMKIGGRKDGLYPISWVATYGKGRTFYCSLGHNEAIYHNPTILQHYLAGLQFVLGDYEVPAIATPVAETK